MFNKTVSILALAILTGTTVPLYAGNEPGNSKPLPSALSQAEAADLRFMREEEKLARDVYLNLHEAWGLTPFANIASSEQSHMDAIFKLLRTYRLADPAAGKAIGEFADPALQTLYNTLLEKGLLSNQDALQVGGIIEETDIRDLVGAMDRTDNADIDAVYERLRCGSRNHLRAFARNLEAATGQPYAAQVVAQNEVDAILDRPMEQCGQR